MIKLIAEDCARVGNQLYFLAYDFNIIFKLDIFTGLVSIVDSLPEENILKQRLGFKVLSINNYMYFPPMNAKKIWRYDLLHGVWKSYELKKVCEYEVPNRLMVAGTYKNRIFFVGGTYQAIVVLNLETDELSFIEKPLMEREELRRQVKDGFFRTDYVLKDNFLYLASGLKNEVFKIDMETYEYTYYTIGDAGFKYSGIDYDGGNFFLSPRRNTPLIRWDGENEIEYINLNHKYGEKYLTTQGALCIGNRVVISGWAVGESFVVENIDGKYESHALNEAYWFYRKVDSDTYVRLLKSGIIKIDFRKQEYQYMLQLDYKTIAAWLGKEIKRRGESFKGLSANNYMIAENEHLDLGVFANSL